MGFVTKQKKPRKTVLSREAQIGKRLREAREFLGRSQKEFAEKIGIQRVRLASYEAGRVPLRWEVALRACQRFLISEYWLATGGEKVWGMGNPVKFGNTIVRAVMFQPFDPVLEQLKPGMVFSEAYDTVLSLEYWKRLGTAARTWQRIKFESNADENEVADKTEWALRIWLSKMPAARRVRFCSCIKDVGAILFDSFQQKNPTETGHEPLPLTRIEKAIAAEFVETGLVDEGKLPVK